MMKTENVIFEVYDNFQKQTYRNRCYIYGANGKQLLNIPIQKVSGKQLTKDIKLDYSSNWQAEHYKSLLSAYNSSPFFEFYIDEIKEVFNKKETFLVDLNMKTWTIITKILDCKINHSFSERYEVEVENDYRNLVNAKSEKEAFSKYTQVFDNKHGFINNLSILDLIFMEGPASEIYLKNKI